MTDGGAVSVLGDVPLGGGLSLEVGYERLVLSEFTYFYDPSSTEGGLDATSTGFGIVTRGVLHSLDRARVTNFHSTSRSEDLKAALGRVLPGWAIGALPLSQRFWIKRGRQLGVRLGYQRMLNGAGIAETYFYLERRRGHRLISSPTAAIGARIKIKF
jgi:hypothetical protein